MRARSTNPPLPIRRQGSRYVLIARIPTHNLRTLRSIVEENDRAILIKHPPFLSLAGLGTSGKGPIDLQDLILRVVDLRAGLGDFLVGVVAFGKEVVAWSSDEVGSELSQMISQKKGTTFKTKHFMIPTMRNEKSYTKPHIPAPLTNEVFNQRRIRLHMRPRLADTPTTGLSKHIGVVQDFLRNRMVVWSDISHTEMRRRAF